MAHPQARLNRVNDLLQRTLSELLHREIKDPRVKLVTILSVEVARDLAHAKVYFSVLDEKDIDAVTKALEGAKGYLRGLLAKKVDLRITPQLHFVYDSSSAHGHYMSDLIQKARASERPDGDDEDIDISSDDKS